MLKKSEILIESLGSQTAESFYGAAAEASVRIVDTLPSTQKLTVRNAYYTSLRGVWFLALGLAAAGLLIILFVRVKELVCITSDTANAIYGSKLVGCNR
jgi:hypothetical protein